jgi:hypothetical protein
MKSQEMNAIRFINPNLYVSNLKRIGRDFKLYYCNPCDFVLHEYVFTVLGVAAIISLVNKLHS